MSARLDLDLVAAALRAGPRTPAELADALRVSPGAVVRGLRRMARHGEVEAGEVRRTGQRGRPARTWRLARAVLELPFPRRPPAAPGLDELLERAVELEVLERRAVLAIAERGRTPAELRELLGLRSVRAAREVLAGLEHRGLAQLAESRGRVAVADRVWELHPLCLTRLGAIAEHWRPDAGQR